MTFTIQNLLDACQNGDQESVQQILLTQPDLLNAADAQGITPLIMACHSAQTGIVEILISRGANPNQANNDGWTPLFVTYSTTIANMLIASGADLNHADNRDGTTPLAWACIMNRANIVTTLINAGAEIERANAVGRTPLMVAVFNNRKDIVKILLEANADPNRQDNITSSTAFTLACSDGRIEIVLLFLNSNSTLVDEPNNALALIKMQPMLGWNIPGESKEKLERIIALLQTHSPTQSNAAFWQSPTTEDPSQPSTSSSCSQ